MEFEVLFFVIRDLIIDILFDMIGWDRQIDLKREPYDSPDIWMDDAPPDTRREDDIARVDLSIEVSYFSRSVTIETEYSVGRRWDRGSRR